ncbi:hypothetical protein RB195_016354 [Necator americanus]|uniref:Uncharacterized protein n=1 Tax=Necator americanus TaxID=51031 RepID=A0ABR1E8S2_NECAM
MDGLRAPEDTTDSRRLVYKRVSGLYNDLRRPADDQVSVSILPDKSGSNLSIPGGVKGLRMSTGVDQNLRSIVQG